MNRYFIENSNIVLKKILSKEENIDIVKDFIESILDIKIKKILIRPYLKSKEKELFKEKKYGIVNVRIVNEKNEELNVGIQIVDGLYLQEKILVYGATIHQHQSEYKEHSNIARTVTINIVDYKGFLTKNYHKIIEFPNNDEKTRDADDLTFHILQLVDYKENEPHNQEEEWIEYLKGERKEIIDAILEKNSAIRKLDNALQEFWKAEKNDIEEEM